MLNIVVLISGSGPNLQAIIDAITAGRLKARIAGVLSNKADAYGLVRAKQAGIATAVLSHAAYASREDFDDAMARQIDTWSPDVVVLAGFMRILTPGFVQHYAGRLLNIHPSLLPAFPGLHTHERALEARKRQQSILPGIGDCGACRGNVLDNGERCAQCGNPIWKYDWLTAE